MSDMERPQVKPVDLEKLERTSRGLLAQAATTKRLDPKCECNQCVVAKSTVGQDLANGVLALVEVARAAVALLACHEREMRRVTRQPGVDPLYVRIPDEVQSLLDAVDRLAAEGEK